MSSKRWGPERDTFGMLSSHKGEDFYYKYSAQAIEDFGIDAAKFESS